MKQEYENDAEDCICEKCERKIKIGGSVFAVNDDWVNICEDCLSDI